MVLHLLLWCSVAFAGDDRALDVHLSGVKVSVGYTIFPSKAVGNKKFDASKPTIVYLAGGPDIMTEHRVRPQGLPADAQVISIAYLGTAYDRNGFPKIDNENLAKNFNSDGNAEVIHQILKRENLSKYILWGESHGVQMALRTIDRIEKDIAMPNKPVAVVLEAGMGGVVTVKDLEKNNAKGRPGQNGKCIAPASDDSSNAPAPGSFPRKIFESYAKLCGMTADDVFFNNIESLLERIPPSVYGKGATARSLKKHLGCPPLDKLNYQVWAFSMSCGVFEPSAVNREAGNSFECTDSPIDVKKYKFGNTAVLGIQSEDDCINTQSSMDYLMDNISGESAYLKVKEAGGHLTYRYTAAWKKCHEAAKEKVIFTLLFAGKAKEARAAMMDCYEQKNSRTSSALPVESVR